MLQYIFIPVLNCDHFLYPYFINFKKISNAFTGFYIAVVFCFINTETRRALARRIYKFKYDNPDKIYPNILEFIVANTLYFNRKKSLQQMDLTCFALYHAPNAAVFQPKLPVSEEFQAEWERMRSSGNTRSTYVRTRDSITTK